VIDLGDGDRELVERCRKGDEAAFEALVRKYQQTVFNLVYHFLGGRPDLLEDVAQKVFIKLYFSLPKFNADRPFYPWLYRIAANQCYDELRKIKRNRVLTFTDLQADDSAAQERLMHAARPAPQAAPDDGRLSQVLSRLLDALPKQYRTALILRDVEERTYEDIGAVFRCSVQAARLKVFRARMQMRRALKKVMKPHPTGRPRPDRTAAKENAKENMYVL